MFISINVLDTTGLVVVKNGYAIIDEIKEENGKFRRDEVGDIIDAKSWVIACSDGEEAREDANLLKKQARKSGHRAHRFALKVSKEHKQLLAEEGLTGAKKLKHCEQVLTSDEENDYYSDDEEEFHNNNLS